MAPGGRVLRQEPYAVATRVFWIGDTGSAQRGLTAIDRLTARWPAAVGVHPSTHASRLNQGELCFSVVQRKVVAPNDLTGRARVDRRLMAFQERYNATARPFGWRFAKNDLEEPPARIEGHEQQHTDAPTIGQAA